MIDPVFSTIETVQIAQIVPCTEAEGPGKRFAIWFQGCPLRCPGCCNPEMLPFHGGTSLALAEIQQQIKAAATSFDLEGITLIGGEPFAHAVAATEIAAFAHDCGLTVMIFSGFTIEELRTRTEPEIAALLKVTDLLVDGRYEQDEPEIARRWIGSRNQRVHFLSDRCQSEDARWKSANTLEIRMQDGEILINGFPATDAVDLWKRLGQPKRTRKSTTPSEESTDG